MRGRGTRNSIRAEDVIMNQPLNDAVAVVTGASSGIGEALPSPLRARRRGGIDRAPR